MDSIKLAFLRPLILVACVMALTSCGFLSVKKAGIGEEIRWSDVPNWHVDNHAESWPALMNNCIALSKKPKWETICAAAKEIANPDDAQALNFYQHWFVPHRLHGDKGKSREMVTGYYEPLLQGSLTPSARYQYPLYAPPDSLLIVDLGELYPSLKGKRVRGRVDGNRVVPFFSRSEIESDRSLLNGEELIWVDNRDDAFFLQIQGSGRVQLPDGSIIGVGYSNQNGHPYVSIGRVLLTRNELEREEISLFTIRQWLKENPEKADALLNENPSYVFFTLRENSDGGPIGSLNVPLTAERSVAIDPRVVSLGTPVWLMTNLPGQTDQPYQRLVLAQDTGGAIKGPLRVDLFWGHGPYAEKSAGEMKERGELIVLLPK